MTAIIFLTMTVHECTYSISGWWACGQVFILYLTGDSTRQGISDRFEHLAAPSQGKRLFKSTLGLLHQLAALRMIPMNHGTRGCMCARDASSSSLSGSSSRTYDLELCRQEYCHGNGALHKQPQLDATYTFLLNLSLRCCALRRAVNFRAHAHTHTIRVS